jgi:predicted permease
MPLLTDFRQAVRGLRKSPTLAAVAITSLAFGIGANVTVYSVVREMILDDLSARQPNRLVRVDADVSYALYRDLRHAKVFQDLAFYHSFRDWNWQTRTRSELAWTMTTSANFFDVLGVDPSAGRLYSQGDEGRAIAVVSYGFWRKRLHADPNAVGQPLELNGHFIIILGVLPRDYRSVYGRGVSPEVYVPIITDPHHCLLFGRLRDGVTRNQTRRALVTTAERLAGKDLARQLSQMRPMSGVAGNTGRGGDESRFFVFFVMLFGVAGMMALIACSNVAGLLLVRGVSRQREMAIRKAVGANRFQVAGQLLAEGFVLVACGTVAGLILDAFLRDRLSYVRWPSAYGLPFEFHFQNDGGLFLYTSLTAFGALLLSSVLPALRGSKADLSLALKQSEPSLSIRRWNLRNGFVVFQVVLSMVLLTIGALFTRSFLHLSETGPGFNVTHTLIAGLHPLPGRYTEERSWDLRQQAIRRVEAIAGVVGVTSTGILPLMGEIPDAALRRQGETLSAVRQVSVMGVGEHYCTTLGIHILRGRDFEITDRGRKPMPVIVNRTLAREFFLDADPIGEYLLMGREKEDLLEIIGVAADSKMRTLGEGNVPAFFKPDFNTELLVRVAGKSAQWIEPLRGALAEVDLTAALDVRPIEEAVAGAMFPMRVASVFVGSLSGLGLVLSLVGLYGSVSYAVSRRTREMGIRAALGASRSRIVWAALRDGVAVLTFGTIAGIPLAISAIRPLVDLIPEGVNPWDSAWFSAVALMLLVTGCAAAWIPAQRVAQMDPSIALRQD